MAPRKKQLVQKGTAAPVVVSARGQYSTTIPSSTRRPVDARHVPPRRLQKKRLKAKKAQAERIAALEAEIARLRSKQFQDATAVGSREGKLSPGEQRGVQQIGAANCPSQMAPVSHSPVVDGPSVKEYRDQYRNGSGGHGATGTRGFSSLDVIARHNPIKENGAKRSGILIPANTVAKPNSGEQKAASKQRPAKHRSQLPAAGIQDAGVQEAEAIPMWNAVGQIQPTKCGVLTLSPRTSERTPINLGATTPWAGGVDQLPGSAAKDLHPNRLEIIYPPLGKKKKGLATRPHQPPEHDIRDDLNSCRERNQPYGGSTETAAVPNQCRAADFTREQDPQSAHMVGSLREDNRALERNPRPTYPVGLEEPTTAPDVGQSWNQRTEGRLKALLPPASQEQGAYPRAPKRRQSCNETSSGSLDVKRGLSRSSISAVRNQPLPEPDSKSGLSIVEQAIQEARRRLGYTSPPPILDVVVPAPVMASTNHSWGARNLNFAARPNTNLGRPASRKGKKKKPDESQKEEIVSPEVIDLTTVDSDDEYTGMKDLHYLKRGGQSYGNPSLRVNQQEGVMKCWNLEYYPELTKEGKLKYD